MSPLERAFPTESVLRAATIAALRRDTLLYIIFILPRSGSTWLTDMAMRGGRLGAPQEWFNDTWIQGDEPALGCKPPRLVGTADINEYARRCVADHRSSIGVMGVQLSYYQTLALMRSTDDPTLATAGMPIFYLRRRNILAQAISLYRSVESGLFHSYQTAGHTNFAAPAYDQHKITEWIAHIVQCETGFESLFASCGATPCALFYEDVLARPAECLALVEHRITGHPPPAGAAPPHSSLRRLAGAESLAWEERFRGQAAAILRDLEDRRPPLGH